MRKVLLTRIRNPEAKKKKIDNVNLIKNKKFCIKKKNRHKDNQNNMLRIYIYILYHRQLISVKYYDRQQKGKKGYRREKKKEHQMTLNWDYVHPHREAGRLIQRNSVISIKITNTHIL